MIKSIELGSQAGDFSTPTSETSKKVAMNRREFLLGTAGMSWIGVDLGLIGAALTRRKISRTLFSSATIGDKSKLSTMEIEGSGNNLFASGNNKPDDLAIEIERGQGIPEINFIRVERGDLSSIARAFEVDRASILENKDLPVPPVISYQRWDGQLDKIDIPIEYWHIILIASKKTGTNPYLMAALGDTESNWNPSLVNSQSGATGLFQFMETTFPYYANTGEKRTDPIANTMAAGKMLKEIGVSDKFDTALVALAADDKNAFERARLAFINSFIGADGSQCWNQDEDHGLSVFDAAIALIRVANEKANDYRPVQKFFQYD